MMKLYFIGTTFGGVLKIGVSHDPQKRLEALTLSGPFDLTIFAVFESSNAVRAETQLHHALQAHRTRGEWFLLSGPVAAVVTFAQSASRLADVVAAAKRQSRIKWSSNSTNDRFSAGMLRYCAFCGKSHLLAKAMVTGAAANICDECIEACRSAVAERRSDQPLHNGLPLPDRSLEGAIAALESRHRSGVN